VRLSNWTQLSVAVRGHLIVGTILVLGSWIGFRRSLKRSRYQVKFFNLPFFLFLLDQLMLVPQYVKGKDVHDEGIAR